MAKGNRGGQKGRSGRKTKFIEVRISAVADQELPGILLKSAKAINAFFDYEPPKKDKLEYMRYKAEVGKAFLVKTIPARFEGEVKAQVVKMPSIEVDGIPLVFDVGS